MIKYAQLKPKHSFFPPPTNEKTKCSQNVGKTTVGMPMVTPLSHNTELVNSLMEYAESVIQCQIPKKIAQNPDCERGCSEKI